MQRHPPRASCRGEEGGRDAAGSAVGRRRDGAPATPSKCARARAYLSVCALCTYTYKVRAAHDDVSLRGERSERRSLQTSRITAPTDLRRSPASFFRFISPLPRPPSQRLTQPDVHASRSHCDSRHSELPPSGASVKRSLAERRLAAGTHACRPVTRIAADAARTGIHRRGLSEGKDSVGYNSRSHCGAPFWSPSPTPHGRD